ncbi:type VI secretion system baseplate subunit TssG [Mesorhizobium sp. CAU 1741]|uniref:type VI secretion system baseplate subunit TssG n=1 Tax=Mesorhizobium sp. CAU 1741 TaxID=3140366 RepID=UPI00325BC3D9
MASARRRPHTSLKSDIFDRPQAYDLFQVLRVIEALAVEEADAAGVEKPDPLGRGVEPGKAAAAIRAAVPLGYAAAEATTVARPRAGGPVQVTQSVIGLTGPSGVLPHAISEMVHVSVRERNPGLREFLDLFNNRLAGLLYEAWAKYRLTVEHDRATRFGMPRRIDAALRAIVGIGSPAVSNRTEAPDETLVFFGGLLGRTGRSALAVERALSGMLGHTVRIEQFAGAWLPISEADRTRLPGPGKAAGAFCRLGEDMVLGERTFDIESSVVLVVARLHYAPFRSLLPDGARAQTLADLAAIALGPEKAFRVRLSLLPEDVPPLVLDRDRDAPEASRLGWNTWLPSSRPRKEPAEVEFRCAPHLR